MPDRSNRVSGAYNTRRASPVSLVSGFRNPPPRSWSPVRLPDSIATPVERTGVQTPVRRYDQGSSSVLDSQAIPEEARS
jgi:hypothetical protein